ncbi:TspO/MBR family domain-containing protein [Ceratobasidium theobromae]|uniref:TspO/MBR family domain-containing protein n=1 Tax=Ceratobasidium theobromae TaxID=1582974 RepID=A0A5N5QUP8_9AGAM|nr:TspO/MBR family domain-containing protein [Ceratobasidium theobromae]
MSRFLPKHAQPFTFEHACQLDPATIAEEISRLQNSLRVLLSTQTQLQDEIAKQNPPDVDLQQAFQENLEVVESQEERIVMLRTALEAQGAAIADNPHYAIRTQEVPFVSSTPSREAASALTVGRTDAQAGDDSEGVYLSKMSGALGSQEPIANLRHLSKMSIFDRISLPPLLLELPRNPVIAVGIPIVFGTLSGYSTASVVKGPWYESLRAPPARPPRQAFGIVWPVLYASMGYASHLAIKAYDTSLSPAVKDAALIGVKMYWVQLGLNMAWSPIFFMWKQKGLALIDIGALTSTVFTMTRILHEPTGGASTYFLVPYCAWLSFATYLNGGYWWLNRGYDDPSRSVSFPRRGE